MSNYQIGLGLANNDVTFKDFYAYILLTWVKREQLLLSTFSIFCWYFVAYLSSYHEKAIYALYELA